MVSFGSAGRLIRSARNTVNRTSSSINRVANRASAQFQNARGNLDSTQLSNGETVFWNPSTTSATGKKEGPPGNPGMDPVRARQEAIDKELGIDRDANATQFIPSEEPGDRRVRIRPKSREAWDIIFGEYQEGDDNILSVLHPKAGKTNGVVFPYTPTITYDYMAEWQAYGLTHTNYQTKAYSRSVIDRIVVSGAFTAQNLDEAKYAFAVLHFFRTVTKMYYGEQDVGSESNPGLAGTPPPVLLFSGYGNAMFNDIPVVVESFNHELLSDVDYVPISFRRNSLQAWVPAEFNVFVTLSVVHDLVKVREQFKLDDFRTGKLLRNKGFL